MRSLWFFLFLIFLFFSGCSTKSVKQGHILLHPFKQEPLRDENIYRLKHKDTITLALYKSYLKWHGTPYKYGGCSSCGVDCSALVQIIYADAFGIKIPRTTKEQAKIGYFVKRSNLKGGDILLFKTGRNSRHSGIYLEMGNFINASSKHGVTISNINNPYWKARYWQGRRVLPF